MAEPLVSCLSGLVGLSAAGSDCFPLPAPTLDNPIAWITQSDTGLYVDQVEGLPLKPAQSVAPGTGLYDLLNRCRAQAIDVVANALNMRVTGQLGAAQFGMVGLLGGDTNGRPGTVARLSLPTAPRPGRGLRLTGIRLATTVTATEVPVLLDGVSIGTLTTNDSGFTSLTDVVIPFDGLPHTLTATLPDGVLPLQNKLTCNCGGDLWVRNLKGNLAHGANMAADAGGFVIQAREACLSGTPLCHGISQDSDASRELKRSVGFAIQYKTAEHLLVHFMANAGYNRYTTLEPKTMPALAERYSNLCEQHLAWLSSANGLVSIPNDCYGCRPDVQQLRLVR